MKHIISFVKYLRNNIEKLMFFHDTYINSQKL